MDTIDREQRLSGAVNVLLDTVRPSLGADVEVTLDIRPEDIVVCEASERGPRDAGSTPWRPPGPRATSMWPSVAPTS